MYRYLILKFVLLEVVSGTHNRKIIRLTEAGKAYGQTIVQHIFEAEQRTIARMSEKERQTCILECRQSMAGTTGTEEHGSRAVI